MFTSLRSHLVRIAVPTVLVAGGLVAAHPAAANDYCVGQISCVAPATWMPSLDAALTAAAAGPNADHITISGGTFVAPTTLGWSYNNASGPVEISGAGIGQTTLTGPAGPGRLLFLNGGPGTTIRDLSMALPDLNATGVFTNANVTRVDVTQAAQQSSIQAGVGLASGGVLSDSSVTMYPNVNTTAVRLSGGTVRNSALSADIAVQATGGGTVERSWLTGIDAGVAGNAGTIDVENSVIRATDSSGVGISAYPRGVLAARPVVNADGVTVIAGNFVGGEAGVRAGTSNAGETAQVSLRNSILRGFKTAVEATSTGGTATVDTSWSDYDTTTTQTTGDASISKSHITNFANPGFVNPISGNFRLSPSSPLIDAGDPAEPQGLDMDGNPRVTDGNLDGTARRDIGAYEVPGPLPVDPPAAVDPQTGGSGDQPAPAGTTAGATVGSNSPAVDTVAPLITGFTTTHKTFSVGQAKTAIAAAVRGTTLRYTLSEAARVKFQIKPLRGKPVATLTRSGARGANALKFSGRVGRRALRPGRYLALISATDAAGNRSAVKQTRFRVVAG